MGDLKPILEAILNGAKTRETEIGDDIKRRISIMNAEFEKEKGTARRRFEEELDGETEKAYESGRARDRQIIKNAEVKAKADFVREVISCAKERIYNLSSNEYSKFLSGLYKSCTDREGCVIYLDEMDKKRVKKGTFGGAEIADRAVFTGGGFVAVYEKISYDFTLDSIFEENYNEICDRINALCGKDGQ